MYMNTIHGMGTREIWPSIHSLLYKLWNILSGNSMQARQLLCAKNGKVPRPFGDG